MNNRDLPARPIVLFAAAMAALIGICMVAALGLLHIAKRSAAAVDEPEEIAASPLSAPPLPKTRLQVAPKAELAALVNAKVSVLHSYGWVDRSAGRVRIPIEQAMALATQQGLPSFIPAPNSATASPSAKEP